MLRSSRAPDFLTVQVSSAACSPSSYPTLPLATPHLRTPMEHTQAVRPASPQALDSAPEHSTKRQRVDSASSVLPLLKGRESQFTERRELAEEQIANVGCSLFCRAAAPSTAVDDGEDTAMDEDAPPLGPAASAIPAALRIPEDVLSTILDYLYNENNCALCNSTRPRALTSIKALAQVHSRFLPSCRQLLYGHPALYSAYNYRTNGNEACSTCEDFTDPPPMLQTLRAFASALERNPTLGEYVRHLPDFDHIVASCTNLTGISPSAFSTLVAGIVSRTPNVVSFALPHVELRDQETLVSAITNMTQLVKLKLGVGCHRSGDGTPLFHEGDLRRIAKACKELEELEIVTENIGCSAGDGWVEGFAFKRLRSLTLVNTRSITNKHLVALVSQSKDLAHFTIVHPIDFRHHMDPSALVGASPKITATGIADLLERRGASLKTVAIDLGQGSQRTGHDDGAGSIPPIEAALAHCPHLTALQLVGQEVVRPSALLHLGSAAPSSNPLPRSFGMPSLPSKAPSLSRLEHLTVGITPMPYTALVHLLQALPAGTSSAGATIAPHLFNLKSLTLTSAPSNCTPDDIDSVSNLEFLQSLTKDKTTRVIFTSTGWDQHSSWVRSYVPVAQPFASVGLVTPNHNIGTALNALVPPPGLNVHRGANNITYGSTLANNLAPRIAAGGVLVQRLNRNRIFFNAAQPVVFPAGGGLAGVGPASMPFVVPNGPPVPNTTNTNTTTPTITPPAPLPPAIASIIAARGLQRRSPRRVTTTATAAATTSAVAGPSSAATTTTDSMGQNV